MHIQRLARAGLCQVSIQARKLLVLQVVAAVVMGVMQYVGKSQGGSNLVETIAGPFVNGYDWVRDKVTGVLPLSGLLVRQCPSPAGETGLCIASVCSGYMTSSQ